MDQHRFDQLLQEALEASIRVPRDGDRPSASRKGESTRLGKLRIAHEHMATAHLRTFIGALRFRETFTGSEPKIVITTNGQLHELGALMIVTCLSRRLVARLPRTEYASR